jgi:hypothetical protein
MKANLAVGDLLRATFSGLAIVTEVTNLGFKLYWLKSGFTFNYPYAQYIHHSQKFLKKFESMKVVAP